MGNNIYGKVLNALKDFISYINPFVDDEEDNYRFPKIESDDDEDVDKDAEAQEFEGE